MVSLQASRDKKEEQTTSRRQQSHIFTHICQGNEIIRERLLPLPILSPHLYGDSVVAVLSLVDVDGDVGLLTETKDFIAR